MAASACSPSSSPCWRASRFLAQFAAFGTKPAAAALIGAAALSRAASLMPLTLLPPARRDGAGAAAGKLPNQTFAQSALLGCGLLLFFALLGGFGMWRGVLACLAALAASTG